MLVAKIRQAGKASNRLSTRTGPWRNTNTSTPNLYQVQNIVDGKISAAHVARMTFYHDSSLGLVKKPSSTYVIREFEMAGILELRKSTSDYYEGYVH